MLHFFFTTRAYDLPLVWHNQSIRSENDGFSGSVSKEMSNDGNVPFEIWKPSTGEQRVIDDQKVSAAIVGLRRLLSC